jgi:hypothetical protein
MRPVVSLDIADLAGTAGRLSILPAGGVQQNNIVAPSAIVIDADGFQWVAGGIAGTPGTGGQVAFSYTVSSEL